jgi:hypothetical protein
MEAFCLDLSVCERHHSVFHEDKWWSGSGARQEIPGQIRGERFDPKDRGRGTSWARWYKNGR